jgi:bifunctional enzyme CysN/CysC/sulfate adenylyltransferase subunit 1
MESLLKRNESNDLLRFSTAGSVDDGKSTLIGRLLHDSKSIFEDQLEAVKHYSAANRQMDIDYSLLTDGLKSEREQGITIDVAYRYFSTPKRRFIIADTPGHEQYTRNMATGCSTSSLALILVDATKGIVTQTRRHTFIASLFGIRHFVVAVNKMDLAGFSQNVFNTIAEDYRAFSDKLPVESIQFIPLSALHGDNVIFRSDRMPWYHGPALLDYLETVSFSTWRNLIDFRFPVQYVNWGGRGSGLRGYCGTIASGIIRPGEEVRVLPSGKESRIKKILTYNGELPYAYAPQAVTIYLEDDLDIGRGDIVVRTKNLPASAEGVESHLVWLDSMPLEVGKTYLVKHTTRTVRGEIGRVTYRLDPEDLHRKPAGTLRLNEIGRVSIRFKTPIFADTYEHNRHTGCFILIDPTTYQTAAAGMITRCRCREGGYSPDAVIAATTFWVVGQPGAAKDLHATKTSGGRACIFLDDAILRQGICSDLVGQEQKGAWLQRVAHLCRAVNGSGVSMVIESMHQPDDVAVGIIGKSNISVIRSPEPTRQE